MKVLGIISEYNPFHLGHLYHLSESKRLVNPDYTIAIMSGNFTQRGEAALVDKWLRTEIAIRCGIDLVIELPVIYASQTAELFAYGGIQLLNHTGLTSYISFGSEIGSLEPLDIISDILVKEDDIFKGFLKTNLNKGLSYPSARQAAIEEYLYQKGEKAEQVKKLVDVLSGSNSILAIEYLKALKRTNSKIQAITIRRISADYNSLQIQKGISSASAIRKEIYNSGLSEMVKQALPPASYSLLLNAFENGACPSNGKMLDNIILGLVRRASIDEISTWMGIEGGLENRIKDCGQRASDFSELLDLLQTKRYVATRLKRILFHGLINLSEEKFNVLNSGLGPKYIRILGFSKRAQPLLKALRKSSKLPVITKPAHYNRYGKEVREMFAFDSLATDIYGLTLENKEFRIGGRDFITNPIIL